MRNYFYGLIACLCFIAAISSCKIASEEEPRKPVIKIGTCLEEVQKLKPCKPGKQIILVSPADLAPSCEITQAGIEYFLAFDAQDINSEMPFIEHIRTSSKKFRMPDGVGVGSLFSEIKEKEFWPMTPPMRIEEEGGTLYVVIADYVDWVKYAFLSPWKNEDEFEVIYDKWRKDMSSVEILPPDAKVKWIEVSRLSTDKTRLNKGDSLSYLAEDYPCQPESTCEEFSCTVLDDEIKYRIIFSPVTVTNIRTSDDKFSLPNGLTAHSTLADIKSKYKNYEIFPLPGYAALVAVEDGVFGFFWGQERSDKLEDERRGLGRDAVVSYVKDDEKADWIDIPALEID